MSINGFYIYASPVIQVPLPIVIEEFLSQEQYLVAKK